MKKLILSFFFISLFVGFYSCEDMDDSPISSSLQVNDFVWRGMNTYYLWQKEVPDLDDYRFSDRNQYKNFLENYSSPYTLFQHLRTNSTTDKFSVIYNDYSKLEGVLSGNTLNNGVDFGLKFVSGNSGPVYGWVRYILPNSDAASKDIHRGDVFYAINGIPLNDSNYSDLLYQDITYTLNLADYNKDSNNNVTLTPNGKSVTLTKTNISENPILINKVLTQNGHNIAYLMYNGFYSGYDNQLNTVFGEFKSQNATDLVLDLRYNSGGSINSATKLASMITGQFSGQLFAKQQWNDKAQSYFEDNDSSSLENLFYGNLNSLNLGKVYILTSKSTASASELVINCLKPYIDVVQIGDKTTGKNVGSITLYDSPTFGKYNINPSHKYAMQPIVLKIVNKDGFGDYTSGITPSYSLPENLNFMGVLGQPDEPLLEKAISQITGITTKKSHYDTSLSNPDFTDSKHMNPLRTEMYLEGK